MDRSNGLKVIAKKKKNQDGLDFFSVGWGSYLLSLFNPPTRAPILGKGGRQAYVEKRLNIISITYRSVDISTSGLVGHFYFPMLARMAPSLFTTTDFVVTHTSTLCDKNFKSFLYGTHVFNSVIFS
jgi:hypothetical protein